MNLATVLASPEWREFYRRNVTDEADKRWNESERWAEACAAGDCAFADENCQPAEPKHGPRCLFRHHHVCPGYLGTKHIEHGLPLMRYAFCKRRREWATKMQLKVRDRKAEAKGGSKNPPPKEWT